MQQTIQLGQVQPSVLSRVERTVKNLREKFNSAITNSRLCQALGITPRHFSLEGLAALVVTFVIILLVCGTAEWLEGGAV